MKKVFAIALALVMLMSFTLIAQADGYNNYWGGIVRCTNLTVRTNPNTSAKKIGSLYNGDVVKILENYNGWMTVDLAYIGMGEGVGYIQSALVLESPCFIVLTKYTHGYDEPWYTGGENGQFSKGEPMLVKSQTSDFYCIQPHKGQAGSSFIRRSDVGRYSEECAPGNAVIMDGPVPMYDTNTMAKIGELKTNTIVSVYQYGVDLSLIWYNDTFAWVDTLRLGNVIN